MTTDEQKQKQKPRRPRVAPHKALLVFLGLALLTPFWILYGFVGNVLSAASARVSSRGLAALGLLALALLGEILLIESKHSFTDPAVAKLGLVASVLVVLLFAQWKLHQLVVFCISRSESTINCITLFLQLTGAVFVIGLVWESIVAFQHWSLVSGVVMYLFALLYVLTPIVVALSHAQWWIPARYDELERLEREIFTRNLSCEFHLMKIAGLGTVFVPCTSKDQTKPNKTIVLVHGFAAGNALWACNLEYLAQHYDVYAIEWVGTGRSDRPTFSTYECEEADAIFVGAIEEWRKEIKLTKFYLAGHSMGAMFASSYTIQYPGHVEHLVLISPAGVGHPPAPGPIPLGLRVFRFLWSLRLTPMSVARYAGPFGPRLLRFIASARISVMPETSCIRRGDIPWEMVAAYWYHNWALKASGEIAMHSHLLPGVFAKKPLCEMLTPATVSMPITFMYGGGPDWMDAHHGEQVARLFQGHQRVKVLMVPLAGHQVYMDNVDAFNEMIVETLEES